MHSYNQNVGMDLCVYVKLIQMYLYMYMYVVTYSSSQ